MFDDIIKNAQSILKSEDSIQTFSSQSNMAVDAVKSILQELISVPVPSLEAIKTRGKVRSHRDLAMHMSGQEHGRSDGVKEGIVKGAAFMTILGGVSLLGLRYLSGDKFKDIANFFTQE